MSEEKQTEQIKELHSYVGEVEQSLHARIDSVETNLHARIDSVERNLNARIDSVERNLNVRIDSVERNLNARIDSVEGRLGRVEEKLDQQSEHFHRFVGMVEDVFQHKINLILDTVQILAEQKAGTDSRVDGVEHRVDSLEVGFAAHRADPNAHRTGYRVREE